MTNPKTRLRAVPLRILGLLGTAHIKRMEDRYYSNKVYPDDPKEEARYWREYAVKYDKEHLESCQNTPWNSFERERDISYLLRAVHGAEDSKALTEDEHKKLSTMLDEALRRHFVKS